MTRMRTVSFKMPTRLVDALDDLAWQRESNRSELVREAIEALTNGKRRSVTAAIRELELRAGVDGPADLPHRSHLADYGK
jgi:metal-responsive CopG/Arc/MetJ family transcriptional regulator